MSREVIGLWLLRRTFASEDLAKKEQGMRKLKPVALVFTPLLCDSSVEVAMVIPVTSMLISCVITCHFRSSHEPLM